MTGPHREETVTPPEALSLDEAPPPGGHEPAIGSPAIQGPTSYRGFLFSDLRGYTAFVDRHGDRAAADLLTAYRSLVREAAEDHAGAEIKTEGDSFYIVFPSASDAVSCALDIAHRAADHSAHHPEQPIAVGIGVHAGETVTAEEGYVGTAANTAARVSAQARAGEVLVTETVRSLVRSALPVRFEARVRRSLKGLAEPVVFYRVLAEADPQVRPRKRRLLPILAIPAAGAAAAVIWLLAAAGAPVPPQTPRDVIAFTAQIDRTDAIAAGCRTNPFESHLWLASLDGAPPVPFPAGTDANALDPAWSPNGAYIAYTEYVMPRLDRHVLRVANSDGSDDRVVAELADHVVRLVSWSPTGEQLSYVASTGGLTPDIVQIVNRDGSGQQTLFSAERIPGDPIILQAPQWLGSDQLAVVLTASGERPKQTVATVGLDGTLLSERDVLGAPVWELAWSPDGSSIAYIAEKDDGSASLNVMAADLTDATVLAGAGPASGPAWSPDGTSIAFALNVDGKPEIHTVARDGTDLRRITNGPSYQANCQPSWASVSSGIPPSASPAATADDVPLTRGPVATGRRRTNRFQPPFEVTVGEGWRVGLDAVDAIGIDRLIEPYGQLSAGRMQVVYVEPCSATLPPTRLVGPRSADVVSAFQSLSHLVVSDPFPTTAGDVTGLRVDIVLKEDALDHCTGDAGTDVGLIFPVGDDALLMPPGRRIRIFALDVRDEAVVFMLDPAEGDFDYFLDTAMPVLDSLRFPNL